MSTKNAGIAFAYCAVKTVARSCFSAGVNWPGLV